MNVEAILGQQGSPEREEALYTALMIGLLPIALRLCELMRTEADGLEQRAQSAIEACRKIDDRRATGSAWNVAAQVIEECFLSRPGFAAVARMVNEARVSDYGAIQLACGLGATVQKDVTPLDALAIYVGGAHLLRQLAGTLPSAWRQLALPFFMSYWLRMVDQQPFRFTPPRVTRDVIEGRPVYPQLGDSRPFSTQ